MTPLLVPAMEREGYRRDVAAAVVAGASIKGAIGPLSVMFIVYGSLATGAGMTGYLGRRVVLLDLGELEQLQEVRPHRRLFSAHDADLRHRGVVPVEVRGAHQQRIAPVRVHGRMVIAGVTTAALGAHECGLRDALADQQHVA